MGNRPGLFVCRTIYRSALLLLVVSAGLGERPACAQDAADNAPAPPISFVIVSLQNWLDAGSIKPGRSFSATALDNWQSPACTIVKDAKVYGHIADVTKASKTDKTSSLTLVFDAADCLKKGKVSLPFMVVEIIGTNADPNQPLFGSMPQEVHGAKQISQVDSRVAQQSADANLPTAPASVDPGVVLRIPNVKLTLATTPDGASKLTGSGENIRLIPGVMLILTTTDAEADLNKPQSAP